MRTYLIAFDVARMGAAPNEVSSEVRRVGESWSRVLDGAWYVRTTASLDDLTERFADIVPEGDGLVIQPVAAEPALINTVRRWFPAVRAAGRVVALLRPPDRQVAA